MSTVLIVSRDNVTRQFCTGRLRAQGYAVVNAQNLPQARAQVTARHVDAVVVDLTSLPAKANRISSQVGTRSLAPLVFIARDVTRMDGIARLGTVLQTPLETRRFLAAIKTAIARKPSHELARGPFRLDLEKRILTQGKKSVRLMKKEFAVLRLLMQNAGELVTRQTLMRQVWETDYTGDTRMIDVCIRWLRKKLEDKPSHPRYLVTVRGQGYLFQIKDQKVR